MSFRSAFFPTAFVFLSLSLSRSSGLLHNDSYSTVVNFIRNPSVYHVNPTWALGPIFPYLQYITAHREATHSSQLFPICQHLYILVQFFIPLDHHRFLKPEF